MRVWSMGSNISESRFGLAGRPIDGSVVDLARVRARMVGARWEQDRDDVDLGLGDTVVDLREHTRRIDEQRAP